MTRSAMTLPNELVPRPGAVPPLRSADDVASRDPFHASGQSPGPSIRPANGTTAAVQRTLHLVGPGRVGRALLPLVRKLPLRIVAWSDRSATVFDRSGLPLPALLAHKQAGLPLRTWSGAETIPTELAVRLVAADIVVDATPTDDDGTAAALARASAALHNGAFLALCSKSALAAAAPVWLLGPHASRIGIHGVLGGAGQSLVRELPELRRSCAEVALVGNVTSTVLLQSLERGDSVAQGIAEAQARGLLEADPTRDLDGSDAATKLRAVWGAVFGELGGNLPTPVDVHCEDLRSLDAEVLRARAARGATTRLVARGSRAGGDLRVRFEELPLGSPLAAPPDRVLYGYQLPSGLRLHTGTALGHERTALAIVEDLQAFLADAATQVFLADAATAVRR
jgi:homoserine dehydrogenase